MTLNAQHMFKYLLFIAMALIASNIVAAQKILSEGTIVYDITVQTGSKEPQLADMFDGVTTTIYLKGSQSRTEMISPLGSTITLQDARNNTGVVLKEYGNQKLLIHMTRQDWADLNKKYAGITFTPQNETKTIAGYTCHKAVAKLKDGTSFTVFYTRELITENKDYDYQFKSLPGLPLEYESAVGDLKVKYSASKITFDPVPVQKFSIPVSGYRELTYQESIKLKRN
jgi:GLPGLI family protein